MPETLTTQLALLPEYLGSHLLITIVALGIGIAISLPLAVIASRHTWLKGPALGLASIIQTIPSLALLALMVPLLDRIGVVPAIIALILYSMLPVLRNTITGLEEADPAAVRAAVGIGMTPTQVLLQVKLPLALPVIIAGIRTATVWTVGIATLSTPVGATSLGNYIFSGLQTQNYTAVLVGCAAAAGLALLLDGIIRALEVAARRRNITLAAIAGVTLLLLIGAGLAPLFLAQAGQGSAVIVGAKTFTEQYILAETIEKRLQEAGLSSRRLDSLGSTVIFNALAEDRLQVYVDYSGTIWANHMGRDDNPGRQAVLDEMAHWLKENHGIRSLGSLGFENAYALAMRADHAAELGIETIADLAAHAADMKIGGDYEFFQRPEWTALRQAYDLRFADEISFDSTLMYTAVAEGQVDVISAFSSDGRIAAFDLVTLSDTRQMLPPYDAVLLLSPGAADNTDISDALKPLIGAISTESMQQANMLVDVEKQPVARAVDFLLQSIRKAQQRKTPESSLQ